jgi:transmembrane sensor
LRWLLYSIPTVRMHYKFFSTEDFIQDELFQQWVFAPNEESNHYWQAFLLHYPLQQKKVDEARAFLLVMKFERNVPEALVHKIKLNLNAAIDLLEAPQKQHGHADALRKMPRKWSGKAALFKILYPVAASLLIITLFIGYFVIQNNDAPNLLQALILEKQKTPKGKQRHIILADGTHVWLNANSELKYAKNFLGKKNREVYLDGEAFFDVSENKEKPFIVHASGLSIKVLGTAFNVRSYADDHIVETTLVRGKVSIASASEDSIHQVTLLPNQQALFIKDSKTMALEGAVNTENYIGWKDGWMIFDDKPFSYIKETLERWYDVSIIMEDEDSLTCTFSAKFKDKTLQEVLEIFRNTESINYRITGDQILIGGKLCEYEKSN